MPETAQPLKQNVFGLPFISTYFRKAQIATPAKVLPFLLSRKGPQRSM